MAGEKHREVFDPFLNKTVLVSDDICDRLRGRYACGPTMENGNLKPTLGSLRAALADIDAALATHNEAQSANPGTQEARTGNLTATCSEDGHNCASAAEHEAGQAGRASLSKQEE